MPDHVDKLLGWGAGADWISPLIAIIQDLTNGPHHHFYVDRNAGWSANEVKRLLKRQGIQVWGLMVTDGAIIFTVRQAQALRAQYLLQQEGIPILQGLITEANDAAQQLMPTKSSDGLEALLPIDG
jgi:hypothetical protein